MPAALFLGCTALCSLSLRDNTVTEDELRATPGFEQYDHMRRQHADRLVHLNPLDFGDSFDAASDHDLHRKL